MRDLPTGAALLALAREVLVEDVLPLLPEEARIKTRLIATCMAIAEREAAIGEVAAEEFRDDLLAFYADAEASFRVLRAQRQENPVRLRPQPPVPEAQTGAAEPLSQPDSASRGDGGKRAALMRRFALDLRKGSFEKSESLDRAARAILWRLTIAKLREGNPGFLAANGINGS